MKPQRLTTKIFLDSGDPHETERTLSLLGFLDGQTTNPSLIAKNPEAQKRLAAGEKFTREEAGHLYRNAVTAIAALIPHGSVSVEVYADRATGHEVMMREGEEMFAWIPNAHIKFPITHEGLLAAGNAVRGGMRVNMTLCFSEEQAAAVYAATRGGKRGDVFLSPFVGRLDDRGEDGMSLVRNILQLYKPGDHHVEVLTASVRTLDHFLAAIQAGSDIITAPFALLKEWGEKGCPMPDAQGTYFSNALRSLPYRELDLAKPWEVFHIEHELTDRGLERFSNDWNALIQ